MDDIEKKTWEMELALWKDLSRNNGYWTRHLGMPTNTFIHNLKNYVLNMLGYPKCKFGCPLCELYFEQDDCPLGDCERGRYCGEPPCYDYRYSNWESTVWCHFRNDRQYALQFYNELIIVFIQRCMEE